MTFTSFDVFLSIYDKQVLQDIIKLSILLSIPIYWIWFLQFKYFECVFWKAQNYNFRFEFVFLSRS